MSGLRESEAKAANIVNIIIPKLNNDNTITISGSSSFVNIPIIIKPGQSENQNNIDTI